MIKPKEFYSTLLKNDISFFTGVPDSLLKNICSYITDNVSSENHIITANEGAAIALGAGYHLATGKTPLVYMQNSGIGNAINPLLSLVDKKVYSIPLLLLIGWRGQPGLKDEPQHIKQGEVTIKLLEAMGIAYEIMSDDHARAEVQTNELVKNQIRNEQPAALIIKKSTFADYELKKSTKSNFSLKREDAIKIIVDNLAEEDIIISTTGKTSRELFEYREERGDRHNKDFLTVGSMGHANQIALGIALADSNRHVFCFDGDGAVIMHTGSLGIIGERSPDNFKHIVFNNGAHDSVGGQPTIAYSIDLKSIAEGFKYKDYFYADNKTDLIKQIKKVKLSNGPILLEVRIEKGSRSNLGRPTLTTLENKANFMNFLRK